MPEEGEDGAEIGMVGVGGEMSLSDGWLQGGEQQAPLLHLGGQNTTSDARVAKVFATSCGMEEEVTAVVTPRFQCCQLL